MLIPLDHLVRKYAIKPSGVVHIGSNVGEERIYYARHGFTPVIWVEALPSVFEKLKVNIAKYPGHVAICACVSDTDGERVTFHESNNSGQSSSFLELGTHAVHHPETHYIKDIPMVTERADTLLARHGIAVGPGWLINCDTQGTELKCLIGLGKLIEQFDFAYLEINTQELYQQCALDTEIISFMESNGFKETERSMTKHHWGDVFLVRK